jgi:hypothetical protein
VGDGGVGAGGFAFERGEFGEAGFAVVGGGGEGGLCCCHFCGLDGENGSGWCILQEKLMSTWILLVVGAFNFKFFADLSSTRLRKGLARF